MAYMTSVRLLPQLWRLLSPNPAYKHFVGQLGHTQSRFIHGLASTNDYRGLPSYIQRIEATYRPFIGLWTFSVIR